MVTYPKVVVGMAVFNAMPFLPLALEAVLSQTHENWELIVTDDGSTDGSREWLGTMPADARVRVILQPERLGLIGNKNTFLALAQGDFVTQLDADDLCAHDRLEKQLAAFSTRPEMAIVSTAMLRIDEAGRTLGRIGPLTDATIPKNCYRPEHAFWFAPMMFRHSLLTKVGLFNPYFRDVPGEDRYWGMRAIQHGPAFILGQELYSYRSNGNSMTNVLDNPLKLVAVELLHEFERQRRLGIADLLEQGDEAGLRALERRLLANRPLLARELRVWAAKAVDFGRYGEALHLLVSSFIKDPSTPQLSRTAIYLARQFMVRLGKE